MAQIPPPAVPDAGAGAAGASGWKLVFADLTSGSVALRLRGLNAAVGRNGRISASACAPIAKALVHGLHGTDPAKCRALARQVSLEHLDSASFTSVYAAFHHCAGCGPALQQGARTDFCRSGGVSVLGCVWCARPTWLLVSQAFHEPRPCFLRPHQVVGRGIRSWDGIAAAFCAVCWGLHSACWRLGFRLGRLRVKLGAARVGWPEPPDVASSCATREVDVSCERAFGRQGGRVI